MGHGDTDKKEDLVLKVLDPGILPVSLCTLSIRMDAEQCHCKGALKDLTSHVMSVGNDITGVGEKQKK